ncbi:PAS domain-containing sensor histidine kinase [Mucilaginibacter flavidus]|uniref:PAS domain-containing sensor histidine kinase n=1 Tax=Mucilaginibacter flavidus TaxID=2949309 RepID=UPI002092DD5F|nr:ATP-binding protein [Mucilaginibacter flavidus]MCO5949388.1 ATP-binding protein [Mucilaginibacter flavidus]
MSLNLLPKSHNHYLDGGGEMGQLIRSFDWTSTEIGAEKNWPQSLFTALSMILNSGFPMFLWWGPNLIQFYNDAYRPSLGENGKHPSALGQPGKDCWPEIWPVIKPLIDQVMISGQATWSEDQLIPIYRNNHIEDVYWTFSYSRVNDEAGKPVGVIVVCYESTAKIQAFNILKETKKELEFAIEATDLSTWNLNTLTNKFTCNARFKSWFGLPVEESTDLQTVLDLIMEKDRDKVVMAIERALDNTSDGNYNVTYSIINQLNNVKRIVKAKGKALFGSDGIAYRLSGTLQDVTEEYQVQQRKDEFLSVASHELNTPLTSLKASLQILERLINTENVTGKIPVFVNQANKNLNKLLTLMEELMNVTKIQEGQLVFNKTKFDLFDLVYDSCEFIRMEKTHEFTLNGDRDCFVIADYRRIDQVIVNFLNNAIKYSPKSNKIEINIVQESNACKVSVRDFGIGISPENITNLFDRYYRVDSSLMQVSGLGLGLYISAEIINKHGGRIGVDSTFELGSTFWFTIPNNKD